jgi:hypothetical protein
LGEVLLAALEAQAAFRHVLAEDDVVTVAVRMADASGVVDLDARVLAAIDLGSGGFFRRGRSRDSAASISQKFGISSVGRGRRGRG